MAMSLFIVGSAHAADIKMGYADLSKLFDEYYKTKDYDKVLAGKSTEFGNTRTKKVEAIQDAVSKLGVLAEDKKAEKEKEIEKMKAELMEFDRQQRENLTKERNEKIREILLEIEKVVSDYAAKQGYTLILNDRVLIYGDKTMDLTEQILKILNDKKPKS